MAHSARNRSKKASGGKLAKGRSTRNRARKELYAKMAEAAARARGNSATGPDVLRSFGRVQRKTNHKRGHLQMAKEARKAEAGARAEELKHMSLQQRLDRLDKRLGKGVGAVKERAVLLVLKAKPEVPVIPKGMGALPPPGIKLGATPEQHAKQLKQHRKEAHDKKMRENRNGR